MSVHPFEELKPEYERLLRSMRITRADEVEQTARDCLKPEALAHYKKITDKLGIPAAWLAAINIRESSGDFSTNLGQGDPLTHPSTHVPKGRPPLGPPPNNHFPVSWEYAATDALTYNHVNDNSAPWSLPYACWKGEIYNGFGPRNHGRHSGYLWAGTNVYDGGKYVSDGQWDPDANDKQLGIIPIIAKMIELDPSLAFDHMPTPSPQPIPPPAPAPSPIGNLTGTEWIQDSLNKIFAVDHAFAYYTPLAVDGNYGRNTREAVRKYQAVRGLDTDGLVGPQTISAINNDLVTLLNDPIVPVPPPKPDPIPIPEALGARIKRVMLARGYQWFPDQNVVSIEGMDPDGKPNQNRPNAFDDIKMILDGDGRIIGGPWEGTTQPGKFWTQHPMQGSGAFIIALGQQTCWTPGDYHGRTVWRQAEDSHILGHRDRLKNYTRQGPPIMFDNVGIHHHGGYDLARDDIANAAAGCQVIRLWVNQGKFMDLSMRCSRYLADKRNYRLTATVLRAADLS